MQDIMVDLETLGTGSDAAFVSIGACYFNPATGEIGETFYGSLNFTEAMKNRKVDGATLEWWFKQNESARNALLSPTHANREKLLTEFDAFVRKTSVPRMWANGPGFDLTIMENVYRQYNKEAPWRFWDAYCVRTISLLAAPAVTRDMVARTGTHHNAKDDAIYQAKYVSKMYQHLKQ